MVYNTPHQYYCGFDLHARSTFTHVLAGTPITYSSRMGQKTVRRLGPHGGYRHSMSPEAKSTFGVPISLTTPAGSTTDHPT